MTVHLKKFGAQKDAVRSTKDIKIFNGFCELEFVFLKAEILRFSTLTNVT